MAKAGAAEAEVTSAGNAAEQERDLELAKITSNGGAGSLNPSSASSNSSSSSSSSLSDEDELGDHFYDEDDDAERDSDDKPSNEKLLCTAFVSFQSFAVLQTGAAYIAGSEAMMGDSAAMMVDALTYLFNMLAERQKTKFRARLLDMKRNSPQAYAEQALHCRKRTLQMELLPPVISVTTLLIVIGFVLHQAIKVLNLDRNRDVSEQKNPNVELMLAFSCGNLLLDAINVACFAKADHALGYKTEVTVPVNDNELSDENVVKKSTKESTRGRPKPKRKREKRSSDRKALILHDSFSATDLRSPSPSRKRNSADFQPLEIEMVASQVLNEADEHDDGHDHANLNMCSAYTHVFADTLRSFAVIVAGGIAMTVDAVTPEEADATAAVIVSVLILMSLVPLLTGLVRTSTSLHEVIALERIQKSLTPETALSVTGSCSTESG